MAKRKKRPLPIRLRMMVGHDGTPVEPLIVCDATGAPVLGVISVSLDHHGTMNPMARIEIMAASYQKRPGCRVVRLDEFWNEEYHPWRNVNVRTRR